MLQELHSNSNLEYTPIEITYSSDHDIHEIKEAHGVVLDSLPIRQQNCTSTIKLKDLEKYGPRRNRIKLQVYLTISMLKEIDENLYDTKLYKGCTREGCWIDLRATQHSIKIFDTLHDGINYLNITLQPTYTNGLPTVKRDNNKPFNLYVQEIESTINNTTDTCISYFPIVSI